MNHTLPPARNLILCFTLMLAVVAGRLVLAESAPNKTEKPAPEQTEPYNGHPRLFFSGPAEKNRLLAGMSPEREAIWKGVLASIKPEVSAGSGRNFGHNLAATALVFGISGDVAYRDGALAGLRLAMSNTELWGGERLNRAEMLYGLAVAYDTLHDLSIRGRARGGAQETHGRMSAGTDRRLAGEDSLQSGVGFRGCNGLCRLCLPRRRA